MKQLCNSLKINAYIKKRDQINLHFMPTLYYLILMKKKKKKADWKRKITSIILLKIKHAV